MARPGRFLPPNHLRPMPLGIPESLRARAYGPYIAPVTRKNLYEQRVVPLPPTYTLTPITEAQANAMGLSGLDDAQLAALGFSLKKIVKKATSAVKSVAKAPVSVVKTVAKTTAQVATAVAKPVAQAATAINKPIQAFTNKTVVGKIVTSAVKVAAAPVIATKNIVETAASKGIVAALKTAPERLLVDPFRDAAKGVTAVTQLAPSNTILNKLGDKADAKIDQAANWSQAHPLETIGAAAAVAGAIVAAPVIASAVAAAAPTVGSAAAAAGGFVAANAGTIATVLPLATSAAGLLKGAGAPDTSVVDQAMAEGGPPPTVDVAMSQQSPVETLPPGTYRDPATGQVKMLQAGMFDGPLPLLLGAGLVVGIGYMLWSTQGARRAPAPAAPAPAAQAPVSGLRRQRRRRRKARR